MNNVSDYANLTSCNPLMVSGNPLLTSPFVRGRDWFDAIFKMRSNWLFSFPGSAWECIHNSYKKKKPSLLRRRESICEKSTGVGSRLISLSLSEGKSKNLTPLINKTASLCSSINQSDAQFPPFSKGRVRVGLVTIGRAPIQLLSYLVFLTGLIAFILTFPATVNAAQIKVAVASNFTTTIKQLKPVFEKQSGHTLSLHFGSTGKLYAQIANGAPFDVFLAADKKRPKLLEESGMALKGSRFTYAQGTLALWAPAGSPKEQLMQDKLANIAITNPKLAPYGMAATQVLKTYGKWVTYKDKLRIGNNISQTYQFVEKGGVAAGMIALAQIPAEQRDSNEVWVIPASAYKPLKQQGVILDRSEEKEAAQEFIDFLQGGTASIIIIDAGYTLPENGE